MAADADTAQPTLGEVVVTAQKRAEKLQDVPISMEVVSGEKLSDFATNDFKQMVKFAPNVSVQTTAGNDTIYIRGFGSPPANFSFDQAVSLYMDGIYAGRNRQAQAPFFDLQRVEVLRGPQGALFGKNTPAGAVSIVSAGPTSSFEGAVTALYNFNLEGPEVSGYVSGPISDTVGARLAVKLLDQDGYIKNLATGHDDPGNKMALARLTLRFAPSDTFDYTLKAEYSDRQVRGGLTVSSPLTTGQNPHKTRFLAQSALGPEGTEATSWLVSGTGNLSIGDFTVTSVTGYSFFRSNIINGFDQTNPAGGANAANSVYNSYPEHFRQWSQEVRLLSPTGRKFEYVVGAYYDTALYQLTQLGGFNIASLNYFGLLNTEFRQRSQSFSVFGQGTYNVNDDLRVIGSLRYTSTDKRGHFYGKLLYGPFALRPVNTIANGKIDGEDNWDPSVTLQYDIAPQIMAYATYGRGSKSGGFVSNTYGTTNATFQYKPERSENIEAGIKSTLAEGRVVLNVSVYKTKFKDLQVSVYNPTISAYQTGNAANASSTGIEGSAAFYPAKGLDITMAAAYQDAKYDDYPGAACLATQPITECNPAVPASIAANNIKGAPLPYVSDFSYTATGHYKYEFGNDMALDTTIALSGRSKYFDSDNQSPLFGRQKGFAKIDARVQYGPTDEKWHVAVVGKNLTDELTTGSAFNLPAPITAVPRAILYLEEGRSIAVEAGLKF
ncbi:MAG: TonB-dependent receptor [Alphaproteobacteria bacterium]|nr:TonB-dependent receptor [Alphaproteobacteria bacterium]MBU1516071.1 TonB-dependent receptor [Alphaproteobacteria bacterium]MBU2092714.1 TonB-dependent receptor [Alphaproteobacteria bacterium]MBU2153761.1 TonB-dependent receptor [Alphaproteobacteria bacterium]MBU2308389.1 TonB-dependent receptor [Alphaproteobacteria bacterium]